MYVELYNLRLYLTVSSQLGCAGRLPLSHVCNIIMWFDTTRLIQYLSFLVSIYHFSSWCAEDGFNFPFFWIQCSVGAPHFDSVSNKLKFQRLKPKGKVNAKFNSWCLKFKWVNVCGLDLHRLKFQLVEVKLWPPFARCELLTFRSIKRSPLSIDNVS